jgi:NTE family protein
MEQHQMYSVAKTVPVHQQRDSEARSVGLVLGGGGGKGGAHLGVISVIEAIGLPIDRLVGTSIGGVIGALYAAGYSLDEIALALSGATMWRLFGRDPSRMSLLGNGRMAAILTDMLGECTFEQLAIPCAVVATDLVAGREVVIDSGPLVEALLATMAFPGIFPPLRRDGMLLVDGGVVNNLPVDVAYALGAQKVIAVDLGTVCDDFQLAPSDGGVLGVMNLLPSRSLTVANRGLSVLIAQLTRYRLAESSPDLLLCPKVEQINSLDLSRIVEGCPAGEQVAHAAMNDLLALRAWRVGARRSSVPLHELRQQVQRSLPVG